MMRFEFSTRTRLLISLAVLLALALVVVYVVVSAQMTGGRRFTAVFNHSGQGLSSQSPVKVRGVTVGGVTSVTLDRRGKAVVTIHVDEEMRVPRTAVAAIEPTSIFGPKFINLILGDREGQGPFLAEGERIERTRDPLDLNDSLGDAYETVAAIDGRELSVIMRTVARGLEGKGQEINRTIGNSDVLFGVAHKHRRNARLFLADTARVTDVLSTRGDEIAVFAENVNAIVPAIFSGRGRGGPLLDEGAEVADVAAHGLAKHRGDIKDAFNSGERGAAVIHSQLGIAGDGVRGVDDLVLRLTALTRIPGPGGKNQLGTALYLPLDPCELIVGICGPGTGLKH
ncbi:MlaD family protein [Bailinhaonella thermotolerans]|uniref:MCE family protein n=1 Tax=Bailinhaonella thermotolerans TaxID=1070861 RepID=A0A3A4B9D0_9ACTN|nr:MlaD family protein [Bailinhaonella thermotolerans]RJL34314.1 MCE family protein [Bailinhaonella thermotolerans]